MTGKNFKRFHYSKSLKKNEVKVSKVEEVKINKRIKKLQNKSNEMSLDLNIPDADIDKVNNEIKILID